MIAQHCPSVGLLKASEAPKTRICPLQTWNKCDRVFLDAAFLLTIGNFLLTVGLFLLTIDNLSFFTDSWSFFSLTALAFLFTIGAFLLTLPYSGKVRLIRALRDCKQRSLTVSKKAPTVSKKASPISKPMVCQTYGVCHGVSPGQFGFGDLLWDSPSDTPIFGDILSVTEIFQTCR